MRKKEKERNKGKFVKVVKGIDASKRRDAKLDKVIINEKTAKKVCCFLIMFSFHMHSNKFPHRPLNTMHQVSLMSLRQKRNTNGVYVCRSGRSGRPGRRSRMQPSRGCCSRRAWWLNPCLHRSGRWRAMYCGSSELQFLYILSDRLSISTLGRCLCLHFSSTV